MGSSWICSSVSNTAAAERDKDAQVNPRDLKHIVMLSPHKARGPIYAQCIHPTVGRRVRLCPPSSAASSTSCASSSASEGGTKTFESINQVFATRRLANSHHTPCSVRGHFPDLCSVLNKDNNVHWHTSTHFSMDQNP